MAEIRYVLVAAGSRHGATEEIASLIGRRLRQGLPSNWQVTVEDTADVASIDGYDAVVLGSAVYMGRWLKAARKLLDNASTAPPKGLWHFSSGPASDGPHDVTLVDATNKAAARLGAKDNIIFSGDIEFDRLGRVEGLLVSAMRIVGGDFRDLSAIERWADEIARELSASDTELTTAEPVRRPATTATEES